MTSFSAMSRAAGPSFMHILLALALQLVFGIATLVTLGDHLYGQFAGWGVTLLYFPAREMAQIGDVHWPRWLGGLAPLPASSAPTSRERMRALRQAGWPVGIATLVLFFGILVRLQT